MIHLLCLFKSDVAYVVCKLQYKDSDYNNIDMKFMIDSQRTVYN